MCGIIGYVGAKSATPILLQGLETLEYRGYDSAGLYVGGKNGGLVKSVGPIRELKEVVAKKGETFFGQSGIAHTRWATHGVPSVVNAHPHTDAHSRIYLVHNGIIENYQELKEGLMAQDIRFQSDTDTEVLTQLIATFYKKDLAAAVKQALSLVRGTFGIAVMATDDNSTLVAARLGSPLIIGLGDDENFVASDASALLPHTKRVVYLNDGDVAILRAGSYTVEHSGAKIMRTEEQITGDTAVVQKDGYDHFMIKEIMEGPKVVSDTIRGRIHSGQTKLGGLEMLQSELSQVRRITIAACGSAYIAGVVGAEWLRTYAGIPVECVLASEYRYRSNIHGEHEALLVLTQSGETADTLAAVREAKKLGLLTLGVVNVVGSSIARETYAGVYNHAGPEVAVASTKAFISQLTVMNLITAHLANIRGIEKMVTEEILTALSALPNLIEEVHKTIPKIKETAEYLQQFDSMMCIGRGAQAAIASEAALKLKEVTYIHAEAYAAGELKHGPIALLDEKFPVLAIAPQDAHYEKMISNIEESRARKAPIIIICTEEDKTAAALGERVLTIPSAHKTIEPILTAVVVHLLSYYVGVAKEFNVDRPRNLAKSVTVE